MGSSCEHGNATSGFIKDREFLISWELLHGVDCLVGWLVVLWFC